MGWLPVSACHTRPHLLQFVARKCHHRSLKSTRSSTSSHTVDSTMCPAVMTGKVEQNNNSAPQTYEEAICSLNRLQSNASVIEAAKRVRASDPARNLTFTRHYLTLIGITDDDLRALNAIHVAGTKGKGSTCVFTESILRQYGVRTGLYSSPHLIEARERIRLHGQPISRHLFSSYFWQTYDAIRSKSEDSLSLGIPVLPTYFMFLTVMAVNVFVKEKAEAAIFEVGIGGEYDCTNFLKEPAVTGITSLALDHVELLGTTLPQIAWQKAGIMKANVSAFTVQQEAAALIALKERAVEKGCQLIVVPLFNEYRLSSCDSDPLPSVQALNSCTSYTTLALGIPGIVQQTNASLAIQLSYAWLTSHLPPSERGVKLLPDSDGAVLLSLPSKFRSGLAACRWPGRYQILSSRSKRGGGNGSGCLQEEDATQIHFFLDGAHTKESINLCVDWFSKSSASLSGHSSSLASSIDGSASPAPSSLVRILLFNCTGYRNATDLLDPIFRNDHFDVVLFSPNKLLRDKKVCSDQSNFTVDPESEEKKALELKNIWTRLSSKKTESTTQANQSGMKQAAASKNQIVLSFTCLTEAVDWIQSLSFCTKKDGSPDVHVLVTGSLHLVGGVLGILDPDAKSFLSANI